MKDNKALVPVLIVVIVIALAIVVWQVMARSGHKKIVDDQGKDLLEPLKLEPGAKVPPPPTPPADGTIAPKGG